MLNEIKAWIKGVFAKMFHTGDVKTALHIDVAVSEEMQEAADLWGRMFMDHAPWLDNTTKSLGLPAAIAGEVARLTTVEMESTVSGSARADWLQGEYQKVLDDLTVNVEYACAGGGLVFKPYRDGNRIAVDAVEAWRFVPTAYNSRREITGAVFVEQATKGRYYYTRLEHHQLTDNGYTIRNVAYMSASKGVLGTACDLAAVDEWTDLEPEITLRYKDGTVPEKMLFAYFRMPMANNIDPQSPVGVSVYSRAVKLIQEADAQYSRILWEYEGSELAIDASVDVLREDDQGRVRMPQRCKRLFRKVDVDKGTSGDLYEVFSPTIRDVSLFNGLDKILKRVEFNCNLAYGTLSDPQNVDKTAEEIRSSKARSYSMVSNIQTALEAALQDLLWAMDFYASLYGLAPRGTYEANFTWGDGVLQDTDKEYARRMDMAERGYLRPEKVISWYFGVSEEEALKYMPEREPEIQFQGL
jgi:A118 family predicted phage portal protein